jgi:hypothetical protein
MKFLSVCLIASQLVLPRLARGQEIIDLQSNEEVEDLQTAANRQLYLDRYIEKVSLQNIEALIGKEKTAQNKEKILQKIIKNSNRYILSSKAGTLTRLEQPAGKGRPPVKTNVVPVELRLSLKNLRAVLLEEGLLYQLDGTPRILPLFQISDRSSGPMYGWWYDRTQKEGSPVLQSFKIVSAALRERLTGLSFAYLNPFENNLIGSVPESYRVPNLQTADLQAFAGQNKASVIVRGTVRFLPKASTEGEATESRYIIEAHLEALQTINGRSLAEVLRRYETDPGEARVVIQRKLSEVAPRMAEDFSVQLDDAWKSGAFGSGVFRLVVRGRLGPKDIEDLKRNLVLGVREIKGIRERVFESGQVTFEVDSPATPQQVAQSLRQAKLTQYKVQVQDVESAAVVVEISKL